MSAYDELRKAVEAALLNLESSGVDERTYDCLNEHFASDGDCPLVKLHKQLKTALGVPARNCDVGTAEEQVERFDKFCLFRKCNECQLNNDANFLECGVRWAQIPYKGDVK